MIGWWFTWLVFGLAGLLISAAVSFSTGDPDKFVLGCAFAAALWAHARIDGMRR